MTTTEDIPGDLPALGGEPPRIGRLNDQLRGLQERGPVHRVRTPAGDEGWLVTRHAEFKRLLLDDRVGKSHACPASMPKYLDSPVLAMTVQSDHAAARETHARMRALLTPLFSARRMAALRPRIAERVATALDRIVAEGPPVDLHARLSVAVSFEVLCDLLGVPDQATFMGMLETPTTVTGPSRDPASFPLFGYLAELAAARRAHPAQDLISALCATVPGDADVAALVALTAFSFLVTPHNISVGIVLLATNPDQRDRVVADPALLRGAVEEVLRMGKTTESFLPRYASEDIEVGDVTIREGDLVMCDHYSTAFDDRVFTDPDRFDVARRPNPHPAFSHGSWYCVGAPLARIEMLEVYGGLLSRLPGLRLDIPADDIRATSDQLGGGIAELPCSW